MIDNGPTSQHSKLNYLEGGKGGEGYGSCSTVGEGGGSSTVSQFMCLKKEESHFIE